ncbi:MAG: LecA/PA-IL family lectin [Blastocatellia bacterium]|nr:LecA/PA-IL family lectin [Blastocatellia bacterium]
MHNNRLLRFSRLYSLLFAVVFLGLFSLTVSADVIRLKNGQTITGKIVSYSDRKFTIIYERSSPDTKAIIALDDIDSVEFDGRPLPTSGYSSTYGGTAPSGGRTETTPPPVTTSEPPPSTHSEPVTPPTTTPDREPAPTSTPTTTEPPPSSSAVRIFNVSVVAKDDWTSTKIEIQKGDKVSISANGTVRLSGRLEATPEGIEVDDRNKLIQDRPTGALIAVIGDDNDEFIFIGKAREFTALRSGKLYLSVNEGDLSDNSGSFTARIQIEKR